MHIPGQEAILCKILAKCLFFRCFVDSGSILRDQMLVLSTQLDKSVPTAAQQPAQGPNKSSEHAYPGSGSNTLQDIGKMPVFPVLRGFWLDFERSNARFLDPVGQFGSNYRSSIGPRAKGIG